MSSDAGSSITSVLIPARPENEEPDPEHLPPHHCEQDKKRPQRKVFRNPWPSFNSDAVATWYAFKYLGYDWEKVKTPEDVDVVLPVQKPSWNFDGGKADKLKATWLSHASFLLELPAPRGAARGARVLFDPVFSEHCATPAAAFLSGGKTRRHTAPPCEVTDLEGVDLVMISHNHYDHLDSNTLRPLQRRTQGFPPHFVVPLNNESHIEALDSQSKPTVHALDWWQSRVIQVDLPNEDPLQPAVPMLFEVTCVPSQHQSNRGAFDRNEGLWAGFTVTAVTEESRKGLLSSKPDSSKPNPELANLLNQQQPQFSCYFAGDTGYAYSPNDNVGKDRCPAFSEIAKRFRGFDLALLPIGAYIPRDFTSSIHASPSDSANIFKDVNASRALGMHWGTFTLTNEGLYEPGKALEQACKREGVAPGLFTTCGLGETVFVDCDTVPKAETSSNSVR